MSFVLLLWNWSSLYPNPLAALPLTAWHLWYALPLSIPLPWILTPCLCMLTPLPRGFFLSFFLFSSWSHCACLSFLSLHTPWTQYTLIHSHKDQYWQYITKLTWSSSHMSPPLLRQWVAPQFLLYLSVYSLPPTVSLLFFLPTMAAPSAAAFFAVISLLLLHW